MMMIKNKVIFFSLVVISMFFFFSCNVQTPVTGVTVSPSNLTLHVGASGQLTAIITPSNASSQLLGLTSSNPSVATVPNTSGPTINVTAIACGTTTITVTTLDGGFTATCVVTVTAAPPAGTVATFTVDLLTIKMMYVPGGVTFPTDLNDSGTATVTDAYWIQETEVTSELWQRVRIWAEEYGGYIFANDGTQNKLHPASMISWRDAMVWTNAITEWYNARAGTSYTPVYYADATYTTPIRTSTSNQSFCASNTVCTTPGCEDNPFVKPNATGFRLPTQPEWEFAARWRGNDPTNTVAGYTNPYFTKGNSASGATDSYNNATATQTVAWYDANSGGSTKEVKLKTPNALGLYDMSGNVFEWVFDWLDPLNLSYGRTIMGAAYYYPSAAMQIGMSGWGVNPLCGQAGVGFRLSRSDL